MYEIFLEKNINSIRQTVDDAFIAKYADLSYPELTTLWQEVGLGSYCDGMLKIINPSDYQDVLNSSYIMDYDTSFLPFMCTAFGDVFAYVKNSRLKNYIVYLNVRYGTYPQNHKADILQQDLSGLFDNSSMIGILGEDCSRIDIHFAEVRKIDDREYEIKGASRTRLSLICPFEGNIFIDSISSCCQIMKSECTEVDGFIYGHYSFEEYGDKRYSGTFSGSFKQGYRMRGQQIEKGRNEIVELKLNLSEYRGKWKSAKGLTKVCSWADEIIPDTPANFCLFNDAGEWVVSPKYRKNGWDNLYNAYHNENLTTDEIQKARGVEEQKWWVNKSQSCKVN